MNRECRIAWAAGFFDGEGYINIQIRSGKYKGHYLRVGINHVAPEPLYEMEKLFGGTVTFSDKTIGNRKPRYRWMTSTKNAAKALEEMLPYMKNKQEVSRLALEFQQTMDKSSRNNEEIVATGCYDFCIKTSTI